MIFLRSLLGGVAGVVLAWIAILAVHMACLTQINGNRGSTRLAAVAGGWGYLLHLPSVLILLTAAFGAGLWAAARW
jgi:hypothetical protein